MSELMPILTAQRLGKRFAGVTALDDVSLRVMPGEVLAVIGENGAGKSTLMKILAGVLPADSGQIYWDGQPLRLRNVSEALQLGIALIHQELNLVDNLSVAENLFLGREPQRLGLVDRRRLRLLARQALDRVGLVVPPDTPLETLSIAEKQLVEIAKAAFSGARLLIMDEPTSSLSQRETERLIRLVDDLRRQGTAIVYISHRLMEVKRLADRVEVLRDGRPAGSLVGPQITRTAMIQAMVGRQPQTWLPPRRHAAGAVALQLADLQVAGIGPTHRATQPVNLRLCRGEIVVLAGLIGAGRTELLETVFGIRRPLAGQVLVAGRRLPPANVPAAIAAGVALVSEDRKTTGLHLQRSVRENLTLVALPRSPAAPRIDRHWEWQRSAHQMAALRIKAVTPQVEVTTLSGGNQQKVALGKWLMNQPAVLLLDEPTRGVDIGARADIYQTLRRLAEQGVAILVASSDMEEVIGIADRVLVMHDQQIRGQLVGDAISESAIMALAVGPQDASERLISVRAGDRGGDAFANG